ncbi:helix-turn-helix domain-containing protein [Paenibacillus sp. KS-LC4]|uniref:helix-turn-helix domain-containing protein n=1 Tax=Paenibacillus sp. KS-LC4 TaxID=2979727 RepID=UPI0030CF248C
MKATAWKNNGKLYSRLLLSITLCIVLTLLISSFFYYLAYTRLDLKQAYLSDVSSLTRTSQEVNSMTESAQSLTFQLYRTFTISKLLFYTKPNIYDVTAAMNDLTNYLSSMPFIESIYVYNSANNQFYIANRSGQSGIFTKEEISDKGILQTLDDYQTYKPFTPIPRSYMAEATDSPLLPGQSSPMHHVYTYLGYDAVGKSQTINSAVIVNISSSWINKDIGTVASDSLGKSFIIDDRQRMLSRDTLAPKTLSKQDNDMLSSQIYGQQQPGYVVARFDGQKSLISYTSSDALEWQYVRVTPYGEITGKVSAIRNTTLAIAAAILAIGLLISWLLSRLLYRPIHHIMDKMNMLETERRNSSYTVRQNILRNLLEGTQQLQTKTQLDKLEQSGITFDFTNNYRVVLIKIDDLETLRETRGNDLLAYKFAIMNISWEIGLKHYRVETVDMNEDSVVLMLGRLDSTEQPDDELLRTMLLQIQQSSLEYLRIGISLTYSPEAQQPQQLASLYKQVKEASLHRLFYGHGCLIYSQNIMELKAKEYKFPVDKEKKLTDALMASKNVDAKQIFASIVEETAEYPIHVVQLAISHLTMTVNTILYTIHKNNSLEVETGLNTNTPSLDKFETVEEMNALFFTLFDDIQARLMEKRTVKQSDLIRKINELIERDFANSNLCLNWIAEELDMSSIYISRVYKQQTLTAVVDVINQVRLEHAKDYLENTDWSVVDIADKSGYTSSSYFHRMFKKSFGVTPADYRKSRLAQHG